MKEEDKVLVQNMINEKCNAFSTHLKTNYVFKNREKIDELCTRFEHCNKNCAVNRKDTENKLNFYQKTVDSLMLELKDLRLSMNNGFNLIRDELKENYANKDTEKFVKKIVYLFIATVIVQVIGLGFLIISKNIL